MLNLRRVHIQGEREKLIIVKTCSYQTNVMIYSQHGQHFSMKINSTSIDILTFTELSSPFQACDIMPIFQWEAISEHFRAERRPFLTKAGESIQQGDPYPTELGQAISAGLKPGKYFQDTDTVLLIWITHVRLWIVGCVCCHVDT